MLKREWNEIGPALWKIPFHSTYENSESQTGIFGRMERAQYFQCLGLISIYLVYASQRIQGHFEIWKQVLTDRFTTNGYALPVPHVLDHKMDL